MILLIAAVFAAEPECRQINLAQDDAHAVERRGRKDGKPEVGNSFDLLGTTFMVSGPTAPDVAATDRAMRLRTKEYAPMTVDAHHGTGCLAFGDVRAFDRAYLDAKLQTPFLMVTVNGTIVADEDGTSLFPALATDFTVNGLKGGDTVDVLVVAEGFQTASHCHGIPTITDQGGTETVCDRGYLLWERREYVY